MNKKPISSRTEFVFLYDVTNANPNGDPANGNDCRVDDETRRLFVTPERIKRTSRDYAYLYKGFNKEKDDEKIETIYVREQLNKEGKVMKNADKQNYIINLTTKLHSEYSKRKLTEQDIKDILFRLNRIIDLRWFGGVFTFSKNKKSAKSDESSSGKGVNFHVTGPIQIDYGVSLHPVECMAIEGTSVFATKDNSPTGTMRTFKGVKYALIGVYGAVNEVLANQTNLTDEDVNLFFECLWYGTMNLRTTSKKQMPRLLIRINHKADSGYRFLGRDIIDMLKIEYKDGKDAYNIRSFQDYALNTKEFFNYLNAQQFIEEITYKKHALFEVLNMPKIESIEL